MATRRRALRQRRPCRFSPRIIIVGEGSKTEYNYFATLAQAHKRLGGPAIMPKKPSRTGSAHAIVESALRIVEEDKDFDPKRGDRCYCVLDVEPHDPAKRLQLNQAMKLAADNNIRILLSNPFFEVWLLSHFLGVNEMSCQFKDPAAADNMLRQHPPKKGKAEFNSDSRLFGKLLIPYANHAVAVAREVHTNHHGGNPVRDSNASTDVYKLVAYVIGQTDTPP